MKIQPAAFLHLLGLLSALHAVWRCRTSHGAIGWGLSLLLCPLLALPAYWTFGKDKFSGSVRDFQANCLDRKKMLAQLQLTDLGAPTFAADLLQAQVGYEKLAQFPLTFGNQVDLLIDGEQSFEAILTALRGARRYVLVEFFILKADRIGKEFQQILIERAAQGVKITLVYDAFGCWTVPARYF